MINCVGLFYRVAAVTALIALMGTGGCAPRTPEVTREVMGLDATGRPVVSYTTCEHYGLGGNLGGCTRETPPVVWCYRSLGDNDCYRAPDRFATRDPEPTVGQPTMPTLYALPPPPPPPAAEPPAESPPSNQQ